jgi:hypothetical protein
MPPAGSNGEPESAARAKRALEHGATALGAQLARSLHGGWRRMSPSRRARLEQLAANVKQRATEQVASVEAQTDVSAVEVHDLRADLARELERLADADVSAARGPGHVTSEAASADGQA